jgi:hypothetical protein
MPLIQLFLAKNTSGNSGFPGNLLLLIRRKIHPKGEIFPARKSFISYIPGFPAASGDH